MLPLDGRTREAYVLRDRCRILRQHVRKQPDNDSRAQSHALIYTCDKHGRQRDACLQIENHKVVLLWGITVYVLHIKVDTSPIVAPFLFSKSISRVATWTQICRQGYPLPRVCRYQLPPLPPFRTPVRMKPDPKKELARIQQQQARATNKTEQEQNLQKLRPTSGI